MHPLKCLFTIEKDEVLANTIFQFRLAYVKKAKVAWNVTLWE